MSSNDSPAPPPDAHARPRRFPPGARTLPSVIALTLLVGAAAYSTLEASASPDRRAGGPVHRVLVRPVTRQASYQTTRRYLGEVVARRETALGFEHGGKIDSVAVDDGARVAAGQELARLDGEELLAQRAQLTAELEAAEARLAELEAGPRKEVLDQARAEVRSLAAQVELDAANAARQARLWETRATTKQLHDQARFTHQARAQALAAARARQAELEAGTRPEILAAQRAAAARARAARNRVDVVLHKGILRAPFDAHVRRRHADEGKVVAAGEPLFELVEAGAVEARAGLPVEVARELDPGQELAGEVRGKPIALRFRARVGAVERATRTVVAVLDLPDPDAALPGDLVSVRVDRPVPVAGAWLPRASLTEGVRGLWSCLQAVPIPGAETSDRSHRLVRVPLQVLHLDGDRAFVTGPLEDGALVVTDGTHRVVPGQAVAPVRAGEAS